MLKKTITYETLDGEETSEDFYFNLSKAQLVEMELSMEGGFEEYLKRIIASKDGATIIKEFKKLILMTYGKKSEDGKHFIKNDAIRAEFESSAAFDALFFELCTDADAGANFVNGIIPKSLQEDVARLEKQAGNQTQVAQLPTQDQRKFEDYSEEELLTMPQADFQRLVPSDPKQMSRAQLSIAFQRKSSQ